MPIICKGALLVTERNNRMSAMTNVACSRSSSVCHLYVLESVTLNARGFETSTARKSRSFHVLPTEKEPLVLRFDLCMSPEPSLERDKRMYRGFLPPSSGVTSSQILTCET